MSYGEGDLNIQCIFVLLFAISFLLPNVSNFCLGPQKSRTGTDLMT